MPPLTRSKALSLWMGVWLFSATLILAHAQAQDEGFLLRVTTREIVVDVIASDTRGHSIKDLKASDFQVFEQANLLHKEAEKIAAVYFIDPAAGAVPAHAPGMLQAIVGGRCADAHLGHYRIAYRVNPGRLRPGDHEITVTTGRPGVQLTFGHHYFVASAAKGKKVAEKNEDESLKNAACFHPERPMSLVLSARPLPPGDGSDPRYAVTIEPRSLDLIGFNAKAHAPNLRYAMCTFSKEGSTIAFAEFPVKRNVEAAEAVQATTQGISNAVPYPLLGQPAYVRYVVRDERTGNMGSVDVTLASVTAAGPLSSVDAGFSAAFGSTLESSGGFCGDLYELTPGVQKVPDFVHLQMTSAGSLYTNTLDVPSQRWFSTFPGTSQRVNWFGIDYYADFWITQPGSYTFTVIADDGAVLFIDGREVLNDDGIHSAREAMGSLTLAAGEHALHLPYYQGPPTSVALQLFITPPGGEQQIFDPRKFAAPASASLPPVP